jgi:hypothetical protein
LNPETERQELLFIWTEDSSLTSRIVGWSFHDGNDPDADAAVLPHARGVDVLADGWRLIQSSQLVTRPAGDEYVNGVLEFEWLFERIVRAGDHHRR